jgi:hypothetical protein
VIRDSQDVVDIKGFQFVGGLPWGLSLDDKAWSECTLPLSEKANWGFLICRQAAVADLAGKGESEYLYGGVGPLPEAYIRESCLGVSLGRELNVHGAISILALACGLSIVERAGLELGDAIVVAGANALALSVTVAAYLQGVRIACLISADMDSASGSLPSIRQLSEMVLAFTPDISLDSELDSFEATIPGKIIYIDAAGAPNPVNYMATRLAGFGTLVLGRPEALASTQVDIYRHVHRKSAQIRYWTRPRTLAEGLEFCEFCHRSARLHHCGRVAMMIGQAQFESESRAAR